MTTTKCDNIPDSQVVKMEDLMLYYYEIKNALKLMNEKKNEAEAKKMSYVTKLQKASKELNDLVQINKLLEEYIAENKNYNEMIEKIPKENNYLEMVYNKNISTIARLKKDMLKCPTRSTVSSNIPPLPLDLVDDFLGFDSVTVSRSETQISYHGELNQSLYYKIQNESVDVQNTVDSLLTSMKQTNLSTKKAIEDLDLVCSQTINTVKATKEKFDRILRNDLEVIEELRNKRCILEQVKLRSACDLNILEMDIKSMGNRVKNKRVPTHFESESYSSWRLKKMSIHKLICIWKKSIRWTYTIENTAD